eukprot:10817230-Alexandrium_andersonii.AAC.1
MMRRLMASSSPTPAQRVASSCLSDARMGSPLPFWTSGTHIRQSRVGARSPSDQRDRPAPQRK